MAQEALVARLDALARQLGQRNGHRLGLARLLGFGNGDHEPSSASTSTAPSDAARRC